MHDGEAARWKACGLVLSQRVDRFLQSGQTTGLMAAVEISNWLLIGSAFKIHAPCPRDQIDFLSTRSCNGCNH